MKRNLHFRPYFRRALPLVFISLLALVSRAAGITALEEDFESMSDGPLDGQNGWIAYPTTLQMVVDSTNNLGSRVLDGLDTPSPRPPWQFTFATKPLPLGDRFSRLSARFDAFSVQDSGGLPSHSSGLRIVATSIPANPGFGSNGPGWKYDRINQGWQFDGRFGSSSSNIVIIPGGFDEAVSFEIIIDRNLLETWGRWSYSGGSSGETPHYALTLEQIDAIDAVQFDQDFRFAATRGVEIDNIVAEYTPLCGRLLWEDFESMTDGPLDSQNGWNTAATSLQMVVDSTNNLGTRVLDGLDTPSRPPYEFTYATKHLTVPDRFGALVARFDTFAAQAPPGLPSHSSGFRLAASAYPADPGFGFYGPGWIYDRVNQGWQFDGRFGSSNSNLEIVPGGFDKKVGLEILVDRTKLETWGTWDFGGGDVGETAHFPLTAEQIDAIDLAIIAQDYRFSATRGLEIDNIDVRCTPPIRLPAVDVQVSGDGIVLSWPSLPGFGYQPQMPQPGLRSWTEIPDSFQMGTGETQTYRYDVGVPHPSESFLRLMVAPLSANLRDGLALHLPFDGDTTDHSPNGTDGINTGATLTPDRDGTADSAYYFDDSGTEIYVPDGDSLDVEELTLAFWFNMESAQTARTLVEKFGGNGNIAYGSEYGDSSKKVFFRVSTDGTLATLTDLHSTTTINTGTWYHFTGTYDGAEMKLYINGALDASMPKTGAIYNASENLRIGRYGYYSGWKYHGSMDEVAVWDRALTPEEVAALYTREGKP